MEKIKQLARKIFGICCLIMSCVGIFTTIFFVLDSIRSEMKTSNIIGTTLCGLIPVCALFGFLAYRLLRKQTKNKIIELNTPTVDNDESKSEQTTYVLTNNSINRADEKPIIDNELPYLIELSKERAVKYYTDSPNPKFHRTEAEDEASFQFVQNHGTESTKICNVFEELNRYASQTDDIKEEIQLLRQAVAAFEKAKEWHYQSKGGKIYFQDMYEYMHNSQSSCFSWVDNVKKQLSELEEADNFIIPWILENAKNGFLQTDIYKAFPKDDKSYLRYIIKCLINSGYLNSEKQGRTYFITTTNKEY